VVNLQISAWSARNCDEVARLRRFHLRHHVPVCFSLGQPQSQYAVRLFAHFVRSIKEACLNRLIPIGERNDRRAVIEYVEHYHGERNHQGLDNRLISGPPLIHTASRVQRRQWLGGLLNFYARAA
jgi:hypothetical protein